jgi:DNA replication initiation complex subunit (GINS family)
MGEVSAITFESLYDTVRKEKTTEDLQKLNPDFFIQVTEYLKSKTEVYKSAKEKNNMNPAEL